jgi:urease beta subunit
VCHTFGVMCRWLGIADVVLRGPEKGGKSAGILENLLTPAAAAHPWFGQFARDLPDRRRLRILDSRLYDLIPYSEDYGPGLTAIGHETLGTGGPRGPGLTMLEFARDREGRMPRIFGVNHHPEIVNRERQLTILRKRMERGEVTPEWFAERSAALTQDIDDPGDRSLQITSHYTLLAPLRHYLYREALRRAEALGRPLDLDPTRLSLTYRPSPALLPSDDRG